jgi:hypothetical protein
LTRRRSQCFDRIMAHEIQPPLPPRFHVLVVDDEKNIRTAPAPRLEEVGCAVKTVFCREVPTI